MFVNLDPRRDAAGRARRRRAAAPAGALPDRDARVVRPFDRDPAGQLEGGRRQLPRGLPHPDRPSGADADARLQALRRRGPRPLGAGSSRRCATSRPAIGSSGCTPAPPSRCPAWATGTARSGAYVFIYPNTTIDLYPDQVNTWQMLPDGVAQTRDTFGSYRAAGADPRTRVAQWANQQAQHARARRGHRPRRQRPAGLADPGLPVRTARRPGGRRSRGSPTGCERRSGDAAHGAAAGMTSSVAGADARERILAAAVGASPFEGIDGVRIARIAMDAGVSSSLVHYHFDTREELLGAGARLLLRASRRATDGDRAGSPDATHAQRLGRDRRPVPPDDPGAPGGLGCCGWSCGCGRSVTRSWRRSPRSCTRACTTGSPTRSRPGRRRGVRALRCRRACRPDVAAAATGSASAPDRRSHDHVRGRPLTTALMQLADELGVDRLALDGSRAFPRFSEWEVRIGTEARTQTPYAAQLLGSARAAPRGR